MQSMLELHNEYASDYVVVNNDLEVAVEDVRDIIKKEIDAVCGLEVGDDENWPSK